MSQYTTIVSPSRLLRNLIQNKSFYHHGYETKLMRNKCHLHSSFSFSTKKVLAEDEEFKKLEKKRNKSIVMNPNGYSHQILPLNKIYRLDEKTGEKRIVGVDRVYGHFWMLKDLEENDAKPILTNQKLIL